MKSGFLAAAAALALSSLPVGATTLTETNITEGDVPPAAMLLFSAVAGAGLLKRRRTAS